MNSAELSKSQAPADLTAGGFSRSAMIESLPEFAELYERRPVQDNSGGMTSAHLFLMWFVLRDRQPDLVVESGVWKGQGTWFIEQACPKADVLCLDPVLSRLQYKSPRAEYRREDFSTLGRLPQRTLAFIDDHQNAVHRVQQAARIGVREMLFEDNYASNEQADCLTLKMAKRGRSYRPQKTWKNAIKSVLGRVKPADDPYPADLIEIYDELPPVFRNSLTRWGTTWPANTPEPLLTEPVEPYASGAHGYTWMAYVRLRDGA